MKLLVIGSSGYIGEHVVREPIEQGHKVILNDINYKNANNSAVVVDSNIFSEQCNLYEDLGAPDIIIHLAWQDGFIHNSNNHMLNLSTTEDWDFLMRTSFITGFVNSSKVTAIYRIWENGKNSYSEHCKKEWQFNEKLIKNNFNNIPIVLPKGYASKIYVAANSASKSSL